MVQASLTVTCELTYPPLWLTHLGGPRRHQFVAFDQVGDEELVSRFQKGDVAAFSELFRRHQPAVSRLVSRMLGVGAFGKSATVELEDLVQDVFIQVYRSLDSFRGQARLGTWIYRIAINVVLMHRRATRARPVFAPTEVPSSAIHPGPTPDEEFVRRRNVTALYEQLEKLSEKKRTVFILHEIEGLSPAEIAKAVGAPVLTVRTRLFYARRELLEAFRSDPYLSTLISDLEAAPIQPNETSSTVCLRASMTESAMADPTVREKLS
ncbi:MAG: RNA polymerase sigma factor [Myxococcales bacterium]